MNDGDRVYNKILEEVESDWKDFLKRCEKLDPDSKRDVMETIDGLMTVKPMKFGTLVVQVHSSRVISWRPFQKHPEVTGSWLRSRPR